MKKNIIKLGLITALSASLFEFTYEIKQGWQQLGALEDLNVSDLKAFNDKCVNYLWFYDNNHSSNPQWKLHIANGNDYDYCGETLTSLKKGQGFWANAKEDCNISIGTTPDKPCVSDMPAPPDLEKPECMTCNTDNNTSNGNKAELLELGPFNYELPVLHHSKYKTPVFYFENSSSVPEGLKEGDILTITVQDRETPDKVKIELVRNKAAGGQFFSSDIVIINDKKYHINDYPTPIDFAKSMRALLPDYIGANYSSFMVTKGEIKYYLTRK